MTHPPSGREIQRWYPRKWSEVAGNLALIRRWQQMIHFGPCNVLVTGPSRTGKTRTISLGIAALFCTDRTPELDPCGKCPSCQQVSEGRFDHNGLDSVISGSRYNFLAIDCGTVVVERLEGLFKEVDLNSEKTIVYLDEVRQIGDRNFERHLLKAIDECKCCWIASTVTADATGGSQSKSLRAATRKQRGLSSQLIGRFGMKIRTSLPSAEELRYWIVARCRAWKIAIDDEKRTIALLIERCQRRPGYALHALAAAAVSDRTLSFEDVERFDFS